MPLHLYKAFAGLFYAGFVRGHDDVLMLHHISIFAGVGLDLAVTLGAEGIKAVVLAVVQHITGKGFSSMRWLTMQTCIQQSAGMPA